MPEGDSVYRLARRLNQASRGAAIVRSDLRVAAHATADVAGHTLLEHDTHGKHLLTRFSGGITLHTHLRMQGSWTVTTFGRTLPARLRPSLRVVLSLDDGATLNGLDLPVVDLIATADERMLIGHLGPDPLRDDWDLPAAAARLGGDPSRAVNAALLDQTLVAGFGNLWANELCFLRGLDPWRPVGEIDLPALLALGARALRHSATTAGAYQVTTGNTRRGESHWVAGRAGKPCRRCRTTVQVIEQGPGGRRTWWCPQCQPGCGVASVDDPRSAARDLRAADRSRW